MVFLHRGGCVRVQAVGYREATGMSSGGALERCELIPALEGPTAGGTRRGQSAPPAPHPQPPAPQPTANQAGRAGRTWFLQPFSPDGRLKTWVYGVAVGVLLLLGFIASMSYLAW
ncbi:hypothetical protein AAFF_G00289320 [Aldrovandia affinis]|uniref:Uncharacterized protein n=1 Tax=Aldrovandia affinis TaxID=143900 RepID=A0AAD7RA97_9TELE|nr:hypothetical protein AAFF_G00289320 [Aldrovandia affinis]